MTAIFIYKKIIKAPKVIIYTRITKKSKVHFPKIVKNKVPDQTDQSEQPDQQGLKINKEEVYPYESILKLITELIMDSKDNLVSKKETSDYFIDSKRFLMNKNGLLEYYLEHIGGVDVDACLEELHTYATTGYLKDREISIKRKSKGK